MSFLRLLIFGIIVTGFLGMVGTPLGINYCNDTNSTDLVNQQCVSFFPAKLNNTVPITSGYGNLTNPTINGTNYLSQNEGFFQNIGQLGAGGTQVMISLFTTDFLFSFIGHVAMVQFPPYFIATFHIVVIIMLIVWVYYLIAGRFASGGTI
jgi:hypothetical protein